MHNRFESWEAYWRLVITMLAGRSPLAAARTAAISRQHAKRYLESLRGVETEVNSSVFPRKYNDLIEFELGVTRRERSVARSFHIGRNDVKRLSIVGLPTDKYSLLRLALSGAGPHVEAEKAFIGIAATARLAFMGLGDHDKSDAISRN